MFNSSGGEIWVIVGEMYAPHAHLRPQNNFCQNIFIIFYNYFRTGQESGQDTGQVFPRQHFPRTSDNGK
jgi:hypothetical protein